MPRRSTASRISLAVVAVIAVAGIGMAIAIPSEAELARRAEQALTEKLGVPVHIGRLHWQLLPTALIEVSDLTTEQDIPLVLQRLTAWPRLTPLLLHRELAFDRVLLENARIPQMSIKGLKKSDPPAAPRIGPFTLPALPLARAEFNHVTWLGRRAIPLEFDGTVDFDPEWRPRTATLLRTGVVPPARLVLQRQDGQDRWNAEVAIANGTWNGALVLQQPTPSHYRLTGELEPRAVDIRLLLEAFGRKPVLEGRASGNTTLEAEGGTPGEMLQSLHTRTRFALAPATILRFDLDRAIHTLGKEHTGSTPLQSLSGVLDTHNDPQGIVMRYSELQARSGALSAHGTAVLQDRRVDADFSVDLVDGVVGVPLKITGPTTDPTYSVPAGALAGAAAGTALLPGVGTVLGARIGDTLGRLFGGSKAPSGPPQNR